MKDIPVIKYKETIINDDNWGQESRIDFYFNDKLIDTFQDLACESTDAGAVIRFCENLVKLGIIKLEEIQ